MAAFIERGNMEWKQIPGFDNYYCSESCDVLNIKTNNRLTITYRANDYPVVKMYDNSGKAKSVSVHRFYMTLFKENPNNHRYINHINGIKADFRLCNLEWCSHSYNMKHAYSIGLSSGRRSLDKIQVIIIKECLSVGVSNNLLAEYFRVHNSVISNIKNKKMYHLHG